MSCCIVEVNTEKIHTPKPIRMSKNNYFSFKMTTTPTKKLEEISFEEMEKDFKLLKSKSEEKLCQEEFFNNFSNKMISNIESIKINSKIRCSNPFYKNFENEDDEKVGY